MPRPFKVAVVGAGPAGLYFSYLLRRKRPDADVRVYETSTADATWGFGVVFSERALEFLSDDDPETVAAISPHLETWRDITVLHRGQAVVIDGIGFSAIGRLALLELLQARAASVGIRPEFERTVRSLDELGAVDLIVGADGLNSVVRRTHEEVFAASINYLTNRFAWYGTTRVFPTLSHTFVRDGEHVYNAHHYRFSPTMSTFLVETDPQTFAERGFEQMGERESRRELERIFADSLQGHALVNNRSIWRQFPVLKNERWHAGNCVLVGDALHTRAYFVQADFDPKFDQAGFARKMAGECGMSQVFAARTGSPDTPWEASRSIPLSEAREVLASIRLGSEDVCAMQLSGGSTGVPKVIPRYHAEYLGHAFHWCEKLGMNAQEICLWALPLLHNAGMLWAFLRTLLYGGTAVLMPRFEVRQFFELVQQHRVTHCFTIGPLVPAIVGFADIERFDTRSVKFFYTLQGAEQIERRTGFVASNMFGITEGLLLQGRPSDPVELRHRTVGTVSAPWEEVRVKVPEGVDDVPLGQVGELCFRGPSSLRGYYNSPEANVTAFTPDGFFRTGDLVSAHVFGGELAYRFEGRMKDNINRGGEKFGTEELEQLIVQHPAIADGKVVAMPDRVYGERACAFLVARPGATLPDVKALGEFLLGKGLAKYKLPERIESIDVFPVTRVGKLDRARLRTMIAERLQAEDG